MHKYSFMTSKSPFLHQDVKLTSFAGAASTAPIFMFIAMATFPLSMTSSQHTAFQHLPHPPYIMTSVIWYLSSDISYLSSDISHLSCSDICCVPTPCRSPFSDFSIFLVSFYLLTEVPKIIFMTLWSWGSWSAIDITACWLSPGSQRTLSQPEKVQ